MLLFGLAMVMVMLWKPRGFVGSREPTAFLQRAQGDLCRVLPKKDMADEPSRHSPADPILKVEHLSMKFGGLVAIGDLSFQRQARRDHRADRPERRRQDHRVQLHHRLLQADRRHDHAHPAQTASSCCSSACPIFEITAKAKVARTFQNIRLFSGMTLLENLLVAQHNKLMKASGYHRARPVRLQRLPQGLGRSIELAKHWLEKADLVDRADDPAGNLPYGAQRRLEIARAMCTGPELLCLDEPAAGLNPKESAALNAAADGHQGQSTAPRSC